MNAHAVVLKPKSKQITFNTVFITVFIFLTPYIFKMDRSLINSIGLAPA